MVSGGVFDDTSPVKTLKYVVQSEEDTCRVDRRLHSPHNRL
jgi:hypothetical protein